MTEPKKIKVFLGGHNSIHPLIKGTEIGYKFFLAEAGFTFSESIKDAQGAVFIELDRKELANAPQDMPIVLVTNEPIVVWPDNFKKKYLKRVNKLIQVGQPNPEGGGFTPWPQDWSQVNATISNTSDRMDRFALINGNRLGFIKGELYSLRRICVSKCEDLDLYGKSWDISFIRKLYLFAAEIYIAIKNGFIPKLASARGWFGKPNNYRGAPKFKFDVLNLYKYSLVIENSMDYMSEKLFDAFLARTIPVYVGPKVNLFNIPENLVVQAEPNIQSVTEAMKLAKSIDYETWKANVERWLNDSKTKDLWLAENVFRRITTDIYNFIDSKIS